MSGDVLLIEAFVDQNRTIPDLLKKYPSPLEQPNRKHDADQKNQLLCMPNIIPEPSPRHQDLILALPFASPYSISAAVVAIFLTPL